MRNLKITIQYDGSNYHGWQVQKNAVTVQEVFQNAVEKVFLKRLDVIGCSRTDSFVHANMYVLTLKTDMNISNEGVIMALNSKLPNDIAVVDCEECDDDFHPRYSCKSKEYVYKLYNGKRPNAFLPKYAYYYRREIDAGYLNDEAQAFVGKYDYSGFCSSKSDVEDTVRNVKSFKVWREGDMIYFKVEADGFLYNMVRIMVGTLLFVSEGKIKKGELKDVIFAYDSRPVLDGITLKIPQNSTCAIVGPSGSGKTTLCNMIARFWDVNSGSVKIGGHDVKEFTCDSLLSYVSMVFQKVYLFNDTIENNIKFGKPNATHAEVVEAAKRARCHDFIEALPQGYETMIGEAGSTLSGGEKQRISIARAILKDAPIVILDEATSSVDPENEKALLDAIFELTKNKTLISIAHRLSTVRTADQIIVIDQGHIVQKGTHKELAEKEGIYRTFLKCREKSISWKL